MKCAATLKKLFTEHGLNKLHFAFDPKYIPYFDPTTMAPQDLLHLFPDGLLRSECAWLLYILFRMGLDRAVVNSAIRRYKNFPSDVRIPKLFPKLEEGCGGRPKRAAMLRMSGSQCMHFSLHRKQNLAYPVYLYPVYNLNLAYPVYCLQHLYPVASALGRDEGTPGVGQLVQAS